jgi:hypothetical protein
VLYAEIAARLARQPLERWIAPEWPPRWYMSGLFREHPAGLFVPAAALARLGYPAAQAAYAANAVYQVAAIALLWRAAAVWTGRDAARPLAWLVQLLPIAFTYRIRANHESAVLALTLAALLGTERARLRPLWALAPAAALVALAAVKGLFVLPALLACALWLIARGRVGLGPGRSRLPGWLALALAVLALAAATVGYESLHREATGASFLDVYVGRQLGAAAAERSAAHALEKPYNAVWYLGRLLWFPFPWSLAAAAAVILAGLRRRTGSAAPAGAAARPGREPPTPAARGFAFAMALAGATLVLFSLSDRRADRYIFPAYYAVGAAGALAACRLWPRLGEALQAWDRRHPLTAVAVWLIGFALHLAAGPAGIRTIKLWPPDA